MSNETDLDWLARNVHEWPDSSCSYIHTMKIKGITYPSWSRYSGESKFTKDQWLASRAESQKKPSWKDAPEWAQFLGQDEDGVWYWHGERPNEKGEDLNGQRYWMSRGISDIAACGALLGDWRDTLEMRPEEFKPSIEEASRLAQEFKLFTSIEDNQEQEIKQDNGWFERGELPPVGVWCEASGDGAKPEKCKIIAYHKGQVALQWEVFNGGCLDILELTGEYWKFRPVRTERELAIKEMVDVICDNGFLSKEGTESWQIAERLYDSRFRKESK